MKNINIIYDTHIDIWCNGCYRRVDLVSTAYITTTLQNNMRIFDYSMLNLTGSIKDLRTIV